MPSPPSMRERLACQPKGMRFPSRLHLEGGLEVWARRLNDVFCCLIEGYARPFNYIRGDVASLSGEESGCS